MLKKLLTIAVLASTGILAAPRAEAGHSSQSDYTYRSGSSSCGCPLYTTRYVRGYDRHRRPIFGHRQAPLSHGSSCHHRAANRYEGPIHRSPVYHRQVRPLQGTHLSISNHGISFGFSTGGHSHGHSRGYSRGGRCR